MQTEVSVHRRRTGVRWGRLLSALVATAGIAIYLPMQSGHAQQPPAAPDTPADEETARRPATTTKVYDIGDLLVDIPDFAGPDSPAGPQARPADEYVGKSREEIAEEILRLMQDTVDADTWRDVGGSIGSVRSAGHRSDLLVITQTAGAHQQIEALLKEMRQRTQRVLRVRAHWIVADRATITALTATPDGKSPALLTTTAEAIDKSSGILAHLRGEIVCMDGQRTAIATFRGVSAVTDVSPVVGERAAAYDPTISLISRGAVLDFQAKLAHDSKAAMMTLRSRVADGEVNPASGGLLRTATSPQRPATRPQPDALEPLPLVDRTVEETHGFHTSLRLPVGKMVLVGGMGLEAAHLLDPVKQAEEGKPIDPPQLYLFLEVSAGETDAAK